METLRCEQPYCLSQLLYIETLGPEKRQRQWWSTRLCEGEKEREKR
jgi:hypothetical protein